MNAFLRLFVVFSKSARKRCDGITCVTLEREPLSLLPN